MLIGRSLRWLSWLMPLSHAGSFSPNFLPLVWAPIVRRHHTKNMWQPMKRKDFDSL